MKKYILSVLVLFLTFVKTFSQNTPAVNGGEVKQVQPTIIIVPYTSSGENALVKYEDDFAYRTAVAEISNALNERGFRPENLQESINSMKQDEAISSLKGVNFDPVQKILNNSTADIVIKAEINIRTVGNTSSVALLLQAVEKSSNNNLYSLNFEASPLFQTTDFAYLTKRCLTNNQQLEKFVNGLNTSFADIIENGKAIRLVIDVNDATKYALEDEVKTDAGYEYISDLIISWVKKHAYKNNYRIKLNSAKQLSFDEIRIPLRNQDGTNYDANDFAKEIRKEILEIAQKKDGNRPKMDKPIVNAGVVRIIMP